jgi:hypothetical protein
MTLSPASDPDVVTAVRDRTPEAGQGTQMCDCLTDAKTTTFDPSGAPK